MTAASTPFPHAIRNTARWSCAIKGLSTAARSLRTSGCTTPSWWLRARATPTPDWRWHGSVGGDAVEQPRKSGCGYKSDNRGEGAALTGRARPIWPRRCSCDHGYNLVGTVLSVGAAPSPRLRLKHPDPASTGHQRRALATPLSPLTLAAASP